jgi:co-chaperonin GroES (HSP10)
MMKPKRSARTIIPAKKVVVIKLVELKSKSGLLYTTEKKQEVGEVIAIGEGKKPVDFKKGDTITFRKFGEDKLYVDGGEYLFVVFNDILGKIA